MDKRKPRGGDHKSKEAKSKAQDCVIDRRSSKETADLLGVSPRKIERAGTVSDYADKETKEAVKTGEMSINRAYEQTQESIRH